MRNIFPRWTNLLPVKIIISLGMVGGAVVAGISYYATPKYTRVGYQPTQPVSYNHEFHAGQLGLIAGTATMELKSHLMQMFLPLMFVCHATKM